MKFLIVDRSPDIRERIKKLLEIIFNNTEIFESNSTEGALEIIKIYAPDIVITDLDLMNGSGVSLIYFSKKINENIKVIVFTNNTNKEIELSCRSFGAEYFLSKADDFAKLKGLLKKI